MATYHNDSIVESAFCDLGAQYITASNPTQTSEYLHALYDQLQSSAVLTPLHLNEVGEETINQVYRGSGAHTIDGMRPEHLSKQHFIASEGTSSIVTFLTSPPHSSAPRQIRLDTTLTSLSVQEDESTKRRVLRANYRSRGEDLGHEDFDCVVLTLPAQQLLTLMASSSSEKGNTIGLTPLPEALRDPAKAACESLAQRLSAVRYSTRFALALFYESKSIDMQTLLNSQHWRGKYVFDDPIVRYLSIENYKFSRDESEMLALLVHTSVPFGIDALSKIRVAEAADGEEGRVRAELITQEQILRSVGELLPILSGVTPCKSVLHTWEQSQVSKGFYQSSNIVHQPAALALGLEETGPFKVLLEDDLHSKEDPLLIIAGDLFTESNFEGCIASAHAAANEILRRLC